MTITARLKNRDKIASFNVEGLTVTTDGVGYDFGGLNLKLDGKLYNGEISSFRANRVSDREIFEGIINAYLRNDTANVEFIEGFEAFALLKSLQQYDGEMLTAFPQIDMRSNHADIYKLDLATEDERFYSDGDLYMLLDKDGNIITDYEDFYTEAISEALNEINSGEVSALYIDSDLV